MKITKIILTSSAAFLALSGAATASVVYALSNKSLLNKIQYHKFELHDVTNELNTSVTSSSPNVLIDLSYPALGINRGWLADSVSENFLKVNGTYLPSGTSMGVDANQGDSHFRFYLDNNPIDFMSRQYTVLTFSGTQSLYIGGSFNVSPSQFRFNSSAKLFETFEPEVSISTGSGIKLVDDVYYIEPGTSLSAFSANVINNNDNRFGTTTITYECPNVSNGYFVKNDGDVFTSCQINVKVDCNYEVFENKYNIKIGYYDFEMLNGGAVSYGGSLGNLKVGASLPTSLVSKLNDPTYGAIFVKKSDLTSKNVELTPDTVFLNNSCFAINKDPNSEEGKVYLHNTEETAVSTSGDKTYVYATLDNVLTKDFLQEWVYLVYAKDGDNYIFSRFNEDDITNNTRSLIDIVNDEILSGSGDVTNLTQKYLNPIASESVSYKVRLLEKGTNLLLNSESRTTLANSLIEIDGSSILVNGYVLSKLDTNFISKKISNNDVVFDFYAEKDISSTFDRIAYSVPKVDTGDFSSETNDEICQKLIDAGYNAVLYDSQETRFDSEHNAEVIRKIIDMFYKHGLKTYVSLHSINENNRYCWDKFPDFTMCPGFAGFNDWDEPNNTQTVTNGLISHAQMFDDVYSNSDKSFSATLFPSYDNQFSTMNNWGEYLHSYANNILDNNITSDYGKTICYDFYPFFNQSGSMNVSTQFLGNLLAAASEAKNINASHWAILQSRNIDHCSVELGENQMKEQAYAAMAYGANKISWYKYYANSLINYDNQKAANEIIKNASDTLKGYSYVGVYQGISSIDSNFEFCTYDYTKTALLNSIPGGLNITSELFNKYPFYVGVYKNNLTEKYSYVLGTFVLNRSITVSIDTDDGYSYYVNGDQSQTLSEGDLTLNYGEGVVISEL